MNVPSNITKKEMRRMERAAKHIPIKNQISMFVFAAFLCMTIMSLWQATNMQEQKVRIKAQPSKLLLTDAEIAGLNPKKRVLVSMTAENDKLKRTLSRAELELERLNAVVERRAKLNEVATKVHVHKSQGRLHEASAVLAHADFNDHVENDKMPTSNKSAGAFAAEVVKEVVRDELEGFVQRVNLATKVGDYVIDSVHR